MVIVNVKMMIKRVFLASVIAPLIGIPAMVSADNGEHDYNYQQEKTGPSQKMTQRSLPSTVIEKQNEQIITNKESPLALDVYLDLHQHWKFVHSNIDRSDS